MEKAASDQVVVLTTNNIMGRGQTMSFDALHEFNMIGERRFGELPRDQQDELIYNMYRDAQLAYRKDWTWILLCISFWWVPPVSYYFASGHIIGPVAWLMIGTYAFALDQNDKTNKKKALHEAISNYGGSHLSRILRERNYPDEVVENAEHWMLSGYGHWRG